MANYTFELSFEEIQMSSLTTLGNCPHWVITKAKSLLNDFSQSKRVAKKIIGLKNYYSLKISTNYRILLSNTGKVFICSHSRYEKKIHNLKRCGG